MNSHFPAVPPSSSATNNTNTDNVENTCISVPVPAIFRELDKIQSNNKCVVSICKVLMEPMGVEDMPEHLSRLGQIILNHTIKNDEHDEYIRVLFDVLKRKRAEPTLNNLMRLLPEAQKFCKIERGSVTVELGEINRGIAKLNLLMKDSIEEDASEFVDEEIDTETRLGLLIAIEQMNNRAIELQKILWSFMDNLFDWNHRQEPSVDQEDL